MAIEIVIKRSDYDPPTKEETVHYFAYCYNCRSVSEENGDYGPPPSEIEVPELGNLKEIEAICKKHNPSHKIEIVGIVHN